MSTLFAFVPLNSATGLGVTARSWSGLCAGGVVGEDHHITAPHGLGEPEGELVVFPQDAYPDNSGPHDYTRAVPQVNPSPPRGRRAGPRTARSGVPLASLAVVLVLGIAFVPDASAETWRGLTIAPEHRCAPYDKRRDYPYPQSVERDIVRELGAVYGPYTGRCFASTTETDIPHLRLRTMRSPGTTTTETAGLPARKHAGTGLPRCCIRTRRIGTCVMGTRMGSCASSLLRFPLLAPSRAKCRRLT